MSKHLTLSDRAIIVILHKALLRLTKNNPFSIGELFGEA